MENIKFQFLMQKEDYDHYADFLHKGNLEVSQPETLETPEDASLIDAKFVELVGVIAVGAITAMAVRLFDLLIQKKENGTIIDFSKNPYEISLVANIPYGTVIIIDRTGKSQVQKIDPNQTANTKTLIADIIEKYVKK